MKEDKMNRMSLWEKVLTSVWHLRISSPDNVTTQIELKTNTNKRTIIHIVTIFVESKKEKDLRTLSRD